MLKVLSPIACLFVAFATGEPPVNNYLPPNDPAPYPPSSNQESNRFAPSIGAQSRPNAYEKDSQFQSGPADQLRNQGPYPDYNSGQDEGDFSSYNPPNPPQRPNTEYGAPNQQPSQPQAPRGNPPSKAFENLQPPPLDQPGRFNPQQQFNSRQENNRPNELPETYGSPGQAKNQNSNQQGQSPQGSQTNPNPPSNLRSQQPSQQYGQPFGQQSSAARPSENFGSTGQGNTKGQTNFAGRPEHGDRNNQLPTRAPFQGFGGSQQNNPQRSNGGRPSQEYGAPFGNQGPQGGRPSQGFGAPFTPPPNQIGTDSNRTPIGKSNGLNQLKATTENRPSSEHGAPFSQSIGSPTRSGKRPSQEYGTPNSQRGESRNQQDTFAGRNVEQQNQNDRPSQAYGAPFEQNSEQTGYPLSPNRKPFQKQDNSNNAPGTNSQGSFPSQEFGSPRNQQPSSSFQERANQRSSQKPSQQYGPPQNGPTQENRPSTYDAQEYDSNPGKNNEYQPKGNQRGEPGPNHSSGSSGNYEFNYNVNDQSSGARFSQSETSDGKTAQGQYNVLLPDGRKQTVSYMADSQGFRPEIKYEDRAKGSQEVGGAGDGYPRSGPKNGDERGNQNTLADQGRSSYSSSGPQDENSRKQPQDEKGYYY